MQNTRLEPAHSIHSTVHVLHLSTNPPLLDPIKCGDCRNQAWLASYSWHSTTSDVCWNPINEEGRKDEILNIKIYDLTIMFIWCYLGGNACLVAIHCGISHVLIVGGKSFNLPWLWKWMSVLIWKNLRGRYWQKQTIQLSFLFLLFQKKSENWPVDLHVQQCRNFRYNNFYIFCNIVIVPFLKDSICFFFC